MEFTYKGRQYRVGFARSSRTCEHNEAWYLYIEDLEKEDDIFQLTFPKIVVIGPHIYRKRE